MNERHVVVFHIASFQKLAFLFFFLKYTGFIICDLKTKNGGERKMRGKDTEWEFIPCSVVGKKIYIIRWNICHEIEIKCTRTF